MDGEECKGKRVLFPGFSKKAALPSEKQKAQIRTGENRGGQLIQRTFAPSNKAKKRDATAAEPHFPPGKKQVDWIQGTQCKWLPKAKPTNLEQQEGAKNKRGKGGKLFERAAASVSIEGRPVQSRKDKPKKNEIQKKEAS